MSYTPNENKNGSDWLSWFAIVMLFLGGAWPISLIWLLAKLFGDDKKAKKAPPLNSTYTSRTVNPYSATYNSKTERRYAEQEQSERESKNKLMNAYRAMTKTPGNTRGSRIALAVGGAFLALVGLFALIGALEESVLVSVFTGLAMMIGGGAMIYSSVSKKQFMERCGRYVSVIGNAQAIQIEALSRIMGYDQKLVHKDLQRMIDLGLFGDSAYLNDELGYLFTSSSVDDALRAQRARNKQQREADEKKQAEEAKARETAATVSMYDQILYNIRDVNDRIKDTVMSEKIDRIENITRLIFRAVEKDPKKSSKIDRFMNYYLPTTLKLLESYAKLENMGSEGDNVKESMQSIEGAMDSIETGFANLLDSLYRSDVIDIKSDIDVMQQMMKSDADAASKDFDLRKVASAPKEPEDNRTQFQKDFGIYPEGYTGPRPDTAKQEAAGSAQTSSGSAVAYGSSAAAVQEKQ